MKASILITLLVFSSLKAFASEETRQIEIPYALQEGLETSLTDAQIQELLPWAYNTRDILSDLLDRVSQLPVSERNSRLKYEINDVVLKSAPKQTELFMRYILNRAVLVNDILTREHKGNQIGLEDLRYTMFKRSIQMALKYYKSDIELLTGNVQNNLELFSSFGFEYAKFLREIDNSIIDASAQFAVSRLVLELLHYDLFRDINRNKYSAQIVRIKSFLDSNIPKEPSERASVNIKYIKEMKALMNDILK